MAYTIQQTIEIGDICTYLAGNAKVKGSLFSPTLDPRLPLMIPIETDALRWAYAFNPSDDTLQTSANYIISICGSLYLQAVSISGAGGIVVNPTTNNYPDPIDFEVSSSSYIKDGEDTKTISSFKGANLLFVRSGVPQTTLTSSPTYYSWDRNTGLFTCYPAATSGEQFQLYPI